MVETSAELAEGSVVVSGVLTQPDNQPAVRVRQDTKAHVFVVGFHQRLHTEQILVPGRARVDVLNGEGNAMGATKGRHIYLALLRLLFDHPEGNAHCRARRSPAHSARSGAISL